MDIPTQHKSLLAKGLEGSEKPGVGVCSLQSDFDTWSNILTKVKDLEKATHAFKKGLFIQLEFVLQRD